MARQLRRAMGTSLAPSAGKPLPRLFGRQELARQGKGLREFIGEVRSELRKVVWPTRREVGNLTLLVLGVSAAVGFVLGGIDYVFAQLLRLFLG